LEQLTEACEPASLRVVQEGATNEIYCKVGKMDLKCFAPLLVPGQTGLAEFIEDYLFEGLQAKTRITMELNELNVYSRHPIFSLVLIQRRLSSCLGEGSFSQPRIESPRGARIGSLVIIFPTQHEGGALLVRHNGHEWSFDAGRELSARMPTIGYVVLLDHVEYEVEPVTSGHRVTLTYDLYHDSDDAVPEKDLASGPFSLSLYERAFRGSFEALLENPEFLPNGGTLGFGLRHVYPVDRKIEHVYDSLKASDAVVYRSFRALGFQPVLYLYHEGNPGLLIDHRPSFGGYFKGSDELLQLTELIVEEGGSIIVRQDDSYREDPNCDEDAEKVDWVTPVTSYNPHEVTFPAPYGHRMIRVEKSYWDLCLVVRIGKAGERLMYPTFAHVKKKSRRR
jgi:hypothetical protein